MPGRAEPAEIDIRAARADRKADSGQREIDVRKAAEGNALAETKSQLFNSCSIVIAVV